MNNLSEELVNKLKLHTNKINFPRNFKFKIYPFFTRNPERAKFKNGFKPIIGVTCRDSLNLKSKFDINDYDISKINTQVSEVENVGSMNKKDLMNMLYDYSHLDSFTHPYLMNYYTLSDDNSSKGEIEIAKFLVNFFNLKDNNSWIEFIGNKKSKNLAEKILLESIAEIDSEKNKNEYLNILPEHYFKERFEDLEYLLENKDFALKYLDIFFGFYYFQFCIQANLTMDRFKDGNNQNQMYKTYYTLENESVTGTRETVTSGFRLVSEIKNMTLVNENLLGYLNNLIEDDKIYTFHEIMNFDEEKQRTLNDNLYEVLEVYQNQFNKDEDIPEDFIESIEVFKKWISEDMSNETKGRFYLSVEEIGNYMFLRNRGRLGKVLTLKYDVIILLTTLIVKDERKILDEVFSGFESRGVFLDRYSKELIVELYERMGVLDKKSDSGEAKYVKPIL